MANAPDRFLTWRWEDEADAIDKKLNYQPDSKKPNAGTFIIAKEDHTIGNLLRMQLLRDPSVRFAGYRMPHPLVFDCHVRVETMDSKQTPINVFEAALNDLHLEIDILEKKFETALTDFEHNRGI